MRSSEVESHQQQGETNKSTRSGALLLVSLSFCELVTCLLQLFPCFVHLLLGLLLSCGCPLGLLHILLTLCLLFPGLFLLLLGSCLHILLGILQFLLLCSQLFLLFVNGRLSGLCLLLLLGSIRLNLFRLFSCLLSL